MVEDPEPGAGMELGLKLTVTLLGWPLADKVMAESKPPEIAVVIVEWPELPLSTVIDVGDALMVKLESSRLQSGDRGGFYGAARGSLHRNRIRARCCG